MSLLLPRSFVTDVGSLTEVQRIVLTFYSGPRFIIIIFGSLVSGCFES